MLHIALHIVVGHVQLELEASLDVLHAGVGASFGVDLAVEEFGGLDFRHHVPGSAVDGNVVASGEFIRGSLRHVQVRILPVKTLIFFVSQCILYTV